jgi:hypothetical protein
VGFGMPGALGLISSLPELSPRLARARGILVPAVIPHRGLLHDEHIDQFVLSSPIHAEIMKVFEMFEKA